MRKQYEICCAHFLCKFLYQFGWDLVCCNDQLVYWSSYQFCFTGIQGRYSWERTVHFIERLICTFAYVQTLPSQACLMIVTTALHTLTLVWMTVPFTEAIQESQNFSKGFVLKFSINPYVTSYAVEQCTYWRWLLLAWHDFCSKWDNITLVNSWVGDRGGKLDLLTLAEVFVTRFFFFFFFFSKLHLIIIIIKLNSLLLIWITLTFIQGHSGMKKPIFLWWSM